MEPQNSMVVQMGTPYCIFCNLWCGRQKDIPMREVASILETGQRSPRASRTLRAVSVCTLATRDAIFVAASSSLLSKGTSSSEQLMSVALIASVTSRAFSVSYFSLTSVSIRVTSARLVVISAQMVKSALPSFVSFLASSIFRLFK